MAAEIPVGVRSIVQHAVLGELAVDLKQEQEHPYWEKIFPQAAKEVLEGEISGSVQADGAVVPFVLVPRLVATADLPTWVDQCASRLMDTIANVDAIKAHVAKRRPEWIPMDPISDLEFVSHLRLTELGAYSDGSADHRWAEHYDRKIEDVFAVQDEVVRTIVAILTAHVRKPRPNGRAPSRPPVRRRTTTTCGRLKRTPLSVPH